MAFVVVGRGLLCFAITGAAPNGDVPFADGQRAVLALKRGSYELEVADEAGACRIIAAVRHANQPLQPTSGELV